MGRSCSQNGRRLQCFKISSGKGPFGRSSRRWKDNIRMDLKEISIHARNWVNSAQDSNFWSVLVNAPFNVQVPCAMQLYISDKGKKK